MLLINLLYYLFSVLGAKCLVMLLSQQVLRYLVVGVLLTFGVYNLVNYLVYTHP